MKFRILNISIRILIFIVLVGNSVLATSSVANMNEYQYLDHFESEIRKITKDDDDTPYKQKIVDEVTAQLTSLPLARRISFLEVVVAKVERARVGALDQRTHLNRIYWGIYGSGFSLAYLTGFALTVTERPTFNKAFAKKWAAPVAGAIILAAGAGAGIYFMTEASMDEIREKFEHVESALKNRLQSLKDQQAAEQLK